MAGSQSSFTDVAASATPKYKTKHTPTHIASSRDGIPHFSPVPLSSVWPSSLLWYPQGCGVPVGPFEDLVSHGAVCTNSMLLGCYCCYSVLGHPYASRHAIPASLDCPSQMGSIWLIIRWSFWADALWLFPKQYDNFVTFSHMVVSLRLSFKWHKWRWDITIVRMQYLKPVTCWNWVADEINMQFKTNWSVDNLTVYISFLVSAPLVCFHFKITFS